MFLLETELKLKKLGCFSIPESFSLVPSPHTVMEVFKIFVLFPSSFFRFLCSLAKVFPLWEIYYLPRLT